MSFDYILPPGVVTYKAMNSDYNTVFNKPSWFTFEEDAKTYSSLFKTTKVHKVALDAGLKLINITSTIFHNDFMNKVLLNMQNEKDRDMLLVPLGIPDLEYQLEFLKELAKDDRNSPIRTLIESKTFDKHPKSVRLFGNHHRCSINVFDNFFVQFIMKHYKDYNGIISPVKWPTCFHGYNFPTEVCIFSPQKDTKFIETKEILHKGGKHGGSASPYYKNLHEGRYDQAFDVDPDFVRRIDDSINKPKNYQA